MKFKEQFVQRDQHRIYARESAGEEPAIVLMHGFPDNLHLYDRLLPHLAPRRIVTFDFLGWGSSDLFLLPVARHFVQMDEPEEVARLILSTPATKSKG